MDNGEIKCLSIPTEICPASAVVWLKERDMHR